MQDQPATTSAPDLDVLVIGAGISGIHAAYQLRTELPSLRFEVAEAHHSFGGTWLIHTYPGVRSDTEVYTLGYSFKPWTGAPYAGAAEIHAYLGELIAEHDLERSFTYNTMVEAASWSTADQFWTVSLRDTVTNEVRTTTARFIWSCHGYYTHAAGHTPQWPGLEDYAGTLIHPQTWPERLDLSNQTVAVIGSGATMATLVPAIADHCASVTVVQRSPAYFFQSENRDPLADQLRELGIDETWIHEIIRRKAVKDMAAMTSVQFNHPELSKAGLIKMVADQLPEGYDVETHFTPRHFPHEQRVARILNGDLFRAISNGSVTMVTDEIATFTPTGLVTEGGTVVDADVVITATGFDLSVLGGVAFTVDGQAVNVANSVTWRGVLFTGLPNVAWTFGALRLSWTMRAEMVNHLITRLLSTMNARGATSVAAVLRPEDVGMERQPFIDPAQFNPGYAQRARALMPKGGTAAEWQMDLDYWHEVTVLPDVDFTDGCLQFTSQS